MDAVPMIALCMLHQRTADAVWRHRVLRESGCIAEHDFESVGSQPRWGQSLAVSQADQPPADAYDRSWT